MPRTRVLLVTIILIQMLGIFQFLPALAHAEFPQKPIHLVVYTAPGGLIDITARKLGAIIQKQNPATVVVVENKKGAGGLLALSHVLRKPADGYTLFGLTSSVLSKAVQAKKTSQLENLHYLARIAKDYECLIGNIDSSKTSLKELLADAKQRPGKQLWLGPASGGTDYLFARKVWTATGMQAKWIPYKSGGEAVAALMGKHGDVYVGNPQDTSGRPSLKVLAVAAPERLSSFPDTPTFKELGYNDLESEVLWRGFAVKKGTPAPVIDHLEGLLEQASKSEEWQNFLSQGNIAPVFDTGPEFQQLAMAQIQNDQSLLGVQ